MKAKLTILGFLVCFSSQVQAANNGCPAYQAPQIAVASHFDEPQFNDTILSAELKMLEQKQNDEANSVSDSVQGVVANGVKVVPGLTAYQKKPTMSYSIRTFPMTDGSVCAQVVRANFTMNIVNTTVYVAKEIPSYTCSYAAVREHELKHVQKARAVLASSVIDIPKKLQAFFREQGVWRFKSDREASEQFEKLVDDYVTSLAAGLNGVYKAAQASVDTPEEYAKIDEACGEEMYSFKQQMIPRP